MKICMTRSSLGEAHPTSVSIDVRVITTLDGYNTLASSLRLFSYMFI